MNNLKNQKIIESDITSINTLIGGGGLSTVSNTLIGAINEIHINKIKREYLNGIPFIFFVF